MSINVSVHINKKSFTGWIQDYKYSDTDGKSTIQKIIVLDDTSRLEMYFDDFNEWKKFIDLFNITDITDIRKKSCEVES
jgi:hypothetical protein